MPEGDTIFRAARTLRRWLLDREITAARSVYERLPAHKLVGQRVVGVEARAKHLLVRFSDGPVLHTHMKMTGSWHVYPAGERWRKPAADARIVLEAGDRIAVCFSAPVVELLTAAGAARHPALVRLGPDILDPPVDHDEVWRRARRVDASVTIGDLLLDQGVVSGIGNIWRCETLFVNRLDPHTPHGDVPAEQLRRLVDTASELMGASVAEGPGAGRPRAWVYGRSGRPCGRCRTLIRSEPMGRDARTVHWCPGCQVRPGPPIAAS